MKMFRICIIVVLFVFFNDLSFAIDNGYQIGSEVHINSYTTSIQSDPAISYNGSNYLIIWESYEQDGHFNGVFARLLDDNGAQIGPEFMVNTYTYFWQSGPAVSSIGTNYMVTWHDNIQDGDGPGIFAQRFDTNGTKLGSEFQVNTYTTSYQSESCITTNGTNYLVVWQSNGQDGDGEGVYGQFLNSNGSDIGSEIRVNSYTTNRQLLPSVASNGTSYLVVWQTLEQDGDSYGIYRQLFKSDGTKFNRESLINTYTTSSQFSPCVASDGTLYLVVWVSSNQDGDGYGIYGQFVDKFSAKVGSEFKINSYTSGNQKEPAVASNGRTFLVVWTSENQDGDNDGVYGQLLDNNGNIGSAFQINSYTIDDQYQPAVTASGADYLISWNSNEQDGSAGEIFSTKLTYQDPVISVQPQSQTIYEGSDVVFTVSASSHIGGVQYQWFKNSMPVGTGSSLLLEKVTMADNDTQIFCVASDSLNSNSTQTAILTVLPGYQLASEILVNTYTTSVQKSPAVSYNSRNFIITWQSDGQDGSAYGIYAQQLDNDGLKIGAELQINTYTTSFQINPSVTSSNNYFIAWQSEEQDGDDYGVFAQFLYNDGSKHGPELQINTYTTLYERNPVVAHSGNRYLVVWDAYGKDGDGYSICGQFLDNDGLKIGSEFQVNTFTTNSQLSPAVAFSNNQYLVVWGSWEQGGEYHDLYGQFVDNDGLKIGSEFQINTYTTSMQYNASIASNGSSYFVAWESEGQDGSDYGVYGQFLDTDGAKSGPEFRINSYTPDNQSFPSVSSNGTDYLVVWQSYGQEGNDFEIIGKMFDYQGDPISDDFHINVTTANNQIEPSVASNGEEFLVAWSSTASGQYEVNAVLVQYVSLTITQEPDALTVDIGDTVGFSVTAYSQNGTIHYAWYLNDILTGTDADTLNLTNVQLADNDSTIYCIVSNDTTSLTSQTILLNVLPPITITQQPESGSTYTDEPIEFTITASSEVPLHYQWYQHKNSTDNPVGTDCNILTLQNTQSDDNGTYVFCKVSNYAYTEFSDKAYITVMTPAFKLTIVGDDIVKEQTTSQYTAYANYGGGNIYDVTTSVVWSVQPAGYTDIASTGLLSAYAIDDDQYINIHAEYNDGSETHWADFAVMIDNMFQVIDMEPYPDTVISASPQLIAVTCNEPIQPATVNPSNCLLIEPGNDGLFGTGDDNQIPVSVSLADSFTINLDTGNILLSNDTYQVKISDIFNNTIQPLDGEFYGLFSSGNGTDGGDFTAKFSVLRQVLSIAYNDNDTVTLTWLPFRDDVSYIIESTDSLVPPQWIAVEPSGQWPIDTTEWTGDGLTGIDQRFYRVTGGFSFILSLTPDEGTRNSLVEINIVGYQTQWQGSTNISFGNGITVDSLNITDSTHLTVKIYIDSSADIGYRDVTITTGSHIETKPNAFYVNPL